MAIPKAKCAKMTYPTGAAATIAVHALRVAENRKRGNRLGSYRCKACGLWHIGHDMRSIPHDRRPSAR